MFKPTLMERIIHRIKVILIRLFASKNRKKLANTDFTIISNNCWGGICYEYFSLKKLSPTVGTFFMAKDYLKFIKNFDYYIGLDLEFISLEESSHFQDWKGDEMMRDVPIGKLGDIEIVFLHYKDEALAKSKWERRVERINRDNMIFKFSQMNNCSELDIKTFVDMDLPGTKICFVKNEELSLMDACCVYYRGFENDNQIYNDTYYWNKYFDILKFLNDGEIVKIQ